MMLDSDGPRSGGWWRRGRRRFRQSQPLEDPFDDLQCRVQGGQAPSQIRYALPEPLQPATCRAVLMDLPTAVLPVPEAALRARHR